MSFNFFHQLKKQTIMSNVHNKFIFAALFIFFMSTGLIAQEKELYFGFPVPGMTPEVFAPGVVSKSDRGEMGSVLTSDGNTVYFAVRNKGWMDIHRIKWDGKNWSESEVIVGNPEFNVHDPALSLDDKQLYFLHEKGRIADIGYVELRTDGGKHKPVMLDAPINTEASEFYTAFTNKGDLVFSSNRNKKEFGDFDIFKAKMQNGKYVEVERFPDEINTQYYEVDAYIAPDESYMVYCSGNPNVIGGTDLYVSFANGKGGWTSGVSLGNTVNKKGAELCPFVSRDGRFLFFSRNGNIYWVDARVLDPLRKQAMRE